MRVCRPDGSTATARSSVRYKQLTPFLPQPRAALADILDQFWTYYRELLAYRAHSTTDERARLDARFMDFLEEVSGRLETAVPRSV